jgi:hypothetical protein
VNSLDVIAVLETHYAEDLLYPGPRNKLTLLHLSIVFGPGVCACLDNSDKVMGTPLLTVSYRMRHDILVTPYTCNNEIQLPVFEYGARCDPSTIGTLRRKEKNIIFSYM